MWQFYDPEECVLSWLSNESSPEERKAMLDWLPRLAADPEAESSAVLPRNGVAAFTAHVPDTSAFIDYALIDQYRVIRIIDVVTFKLTDVLPPDLPEGGSPQSGT